MNKKSLVVGFLLLAILDTVAQVGFKLAGESAGEPSISLGWIARVFLGHWIYVAISAVLGAFVCWMTLLKHAAVGPAFAASHLEVVTVLLFSVVWFGERLSLVQTAGCVLIVVGIGFLGAEETATGKASEPTDHVP